jgi:hypothetical protein
VGRRRIRAFAGVKADRWELRAVSRDGQALHLQVAGYAAPEEYFRDDLKAAAVTGRPDYRKLENPVAEENSLTWTFPGVQLVSGAIFVPYEFHHGLPDKYRYEVCQEDGSWVEVSCGEFSNIRANPVPQVTEWASPVRGTAVRLIVEHLVEPHYRVLCREFGVLVG